MSVSNLYKQTDDMWRWVGGVGLFILFISVSHLLGRSLFLGDSDGFMHQIFSVREGEDLGSLMFLHWARYLIVFPFIVIGNAYLDPAIFFCYVGLFFFSKNREIRLIALLCLLLSLFFSYRSILVMLSIALLVDHILYNRKGIGVLFYSLLLSLLSTGVFVAYFIIFFKYRRVIFSGKWLIAINLLLLVAIIFVSGSLAHKILFFLDRSTFENADVVTMDALSRLNFSSMQVIVSNLLERGILLESYRDGSSRLFLIAAFGFLVSLLLYLRRDGMSFIITFLFLCGLCMEGLMLYSLFVTVLFLILLEFRMPEIRLGRVRLL